jgi:hypothetical protein
MEGTTSTEWVAKKELEKRKRKERKGIFLTGSPIRSGMTEGGVSASEIPV